MSARIVKSKSLPAEFAYLLDHHAVNETYHNAFARDPTLRVGALTALDYACKVVTDFDLAFALVEEGADPVVPFNTDGHDPLEAAVEGGSYDILRFLLNTWRSKLPSLRRDLERLKLSGIRALVAAVRLGRPDMVQLLLDSGAKVNYEDATIYSPLSVALSAYPYNPEVTVLLINAGADYYFRSAYKYQLDATNQPAFFACRNGDAVRQLAFLGCDFAQECERGSFLRATLERRRYGRRPGEWLSILEELSELGIRDVSIWATKWPENYEDTLRDLGFDETPEQVANRYNRYNPITPYQPTC